MGHVMAAWLFVASIALMAAFCAWVLAGIARMLAVELMRRKEDRR